ncbi:Ground-like domain protein [Aphelenchoides fujianensis]|nr:Ground-like domain protein [Aphelenchoides fujianensis]
MLAAVCSLLLFASIQPTAGFLFAGAGGSAGCSCCAPPPPPPVCPQPAACPCAAARVHDEKTVVVQPLDELELRARLSGVELESQPAAGDSLLPPPRQLELLERLGEEEPVIISAPTPPRAHSYNLTAGGEADVRFAPQNSVSEETADDAQTIEANVEEATRVDSSTHQPPTDGNEPAVEAEKINCNSHVLKKLMVDAMTENSAVSKRKIAAAAEGLFGGAMDVICSRSHFSYTFTSALFCEASKGEVTCVAFRQRIS